jgi:hypothetical protein
VAGTVHQGQSNWITFFRSVTPWLILQPCTSTPLWVEYVKQVSKRQIEMLGNIESTMQSRFNSSSCKASRCSAGQIIFFFPSFVVPGSLLCPHNSTIQIYHEPVESSLQSLLYIQFAISSIFRSAPVLLNVLVPLDFTTKRSKQFLCSIFFEDPIYLQSVIIH